MWKRVVSIILTLVTILSLTACTSKETKEAQESFSTNKLLRFEKYVDLSKRLGQVTIYGYLSPYSPQDGSFAYLVSSPYDSNITSSNNILDRFIRIYPKEDMKISFTGLPVKVTGILLYSNETDAFDLTYQYSITNCEVTTIEEEYVTDDIYYYSVMVANGVTEAILTGMYAVYYDLHYEEFGYDESTLEIYPTTSVDYSKGMIDLYDNRVCNELGVINDKLITLLNNVNNCVETKNYTKLVTYKEDYEEIESLFAAWSRTLKIEV